MSDSIRPDFLDVPLLFPEEIRRPLGAMPHLLTDLFGNTISVRDPDSLPAEAVELRIGDLPVARLQAPDAFRELLKDLLEGTIALERRSIWSACELENKRMITADLESLLDLSETEQTPFESQLNQILRLLRSHIWAEVATIFVIFDGVTLERLVSGGSQPDDLGLVLAAETAAARKSLFRSESPPLEPGGGSSLRNVFAHPLLHGQSLVGVLCLGNRIGGEFTQGDTETAAMFCNVASHIIQKHVFKERMKSFERESGQLGKYLSTKVAKSVKSSSQLQLGGVEKNVICLFADIRGYTSITEGTSPETLVKLLNFHFERMHAVIEKYEGTLDKIVGDLIMAVWNVPDDQPEPELQAMKAAIQMQKEMIRVVAPEWARNGVEKVGMGIGLNAGPALVGNLGSSRFMNYTVVGDAVNTAQRLESKAQAGEIWVAEEIYPLLAGKVEKPSRKASAIRLKGKEKTINAYVYRPLAP
jgi:class 3 adenylate cyclase